MEPTAAELTLVDRVLRLLSQRVLSYDGAIQTTVRGRTSAGWQNLLTKFEFIRKGEPAPDALAFEYREVVITKRGLPNGKAEALFKQLILERSLDVDTDCERLEFPTAFSVQSRVRWTRSEWS